MKISTGMFFTKDELNRVPPPRARADTQLKLKMTVVPEDFNMQWVVVTH